MKVNIGPYTDGEEKRKIKVKAHGYDAWSADSTLAFVIAPVLKKLRGMVHGYPGEFVTEEDEDGSEGMKKWKGILDKMIWAFEQVNENYEEQYFSGEIDWGFEPCEDNKFISKMCRGPNHTFKVDNDAIAAHEAKMQEGFDLFAKYYRNLWD